MPPFHIGIDLDNTIIDYEHVFAPVAEQLGLLPSGSGLTSKASVKAHLHADGGEAVWMRLQGQVYGRFIGLSSPYPGVIAFLGTVRARGARVSIVSHKTQHGHFDIDRIDLWSAAAGWLEQQRFFAADGGNLDPSSVYFETTRRAKLARIASLGCHIFIDDLPEVLLDPSFPASVEPRWFAGNQSGPAGPGLQALSTWSDVLDTVVPRL